MVTPPEVVEDIDKGKKKKKKKKSKKKKKEKATDVTVYESESEGEEKKGPYLPEIKEDVVNEQKDDSMQIPDSAHNSTKKQERGADSFRADQKEEDEKSNLRVKEAPNEMN